MSQWVVEQNSEWVSFPSEWSNGSDEYYVIITTQKFIINPKMYAFEANNRDYAFVANEKSYNITAENNNTGFIAASKKYHFINED